MAQEQANGVRLKLLVDKKKKTVVFAESGSDFVNVLCSLLTIPMGKVVRVASESQEKTLGCFSNLYQSVENTDSLHFHFGTDACKSMLLAPRSGAERHCAELKLKIDDSDPTSYFLCSGYRFSDCSYQKSQYPNVLCRSLHCMNDLTSSSRIRVDKDGSGNVFVGGGNTFIVTDDLRVMPASSQTIFSLFSKHGITIDSELEEITLTLDTTQVKTMLVGSLMSRSVLTDSIFPKNEQGVKLSDEVSFVKLNSTGCERDEQHVELIKVKLIISKSTRKVCYAEASRDFVNLIFSFLTVPIGHIVKQIDGESRLNMCIDSLYRSVVELDNHCFKTIYDKQMLVSPSLSYGFSYRNDLLEIQKSSNMGYYSWLSMTDDGFLTGSTAFVVSDCLKVTPISAMVCFSILKDLKVRSDDTVEHVVHVGKDEALLLLVNSLLTENALTNTFFKKPKKEN